MWICLNDAFLSAVEHDPKTLKVRARKRQHLVRHFPGYRIIPTPSADYGWRIYIPKEQFANWLAAKAATISYPNFKDSVRENALHALYARFWQDHANYQDAGRKSAPRGSLWRQRRLFPASAD